MMVLEVDWAIYKRLVGWPLDAQGRPRVDDKGVPVNREVIGPPDLNPYERIWDEEKQEYISFPPVLPSYGIRIPLLKGGAKTTQGMTSFSPAGLIDKLEPNAFRQVPVFDQNISGRKFEDVWPCVTFRWFGMDFDPKTFVYHDPFGSPDLASAPVEIRNESGELIQSGFSKNLRRPHPESWPVNYVITAWAKSAVELALICNEIVRLFPARGAINVEFASGEKHACDMLLVRTETLDEGGDRVLMTRGAEEQREYARAFVYTVESYIDNTVNRYGVQDTRSYVAVRERLLELDRIMGDLAIEGQEKDLNLGELEPITE